MPEATIETINNWLITEYWNVYPRNGDVDFLCQHYDPTKELIENTRKKLAETGITDYELDDPFN